MTDPHAPGGVPAKSGDVQPQIGSVWGCAAIVLIGFIAVGVLVYYIRPNTDESERGHGGHGSHSGGGFAASQGTGSNSANATGKDAAGAKDAAGSKDSSSGTRSTGTGSGGGKGSGKWGSFNQDPLPVVAAIIEPGNIDIALNELGSVTSMATVTVKTQIPGQLVKIAFTEGQLVKTGDLLAQIDDRPYVLMLLQSRGALERDQALLKEAQLDLTRYETLVKQDSIATQQRDTQASLVQQYIGTVATDEAQVRTAQLNIDYCHIVSPVDGLAGLRQVDQGNYVQPSDANGVVIVTQMQPMSVIFNLPEDNVPALQKRLRAKAPVPVWAFDRSQSRKIAEGQVLSIDSQIDATTGTLRVRAQFPNDDDALFPNQFVNVRMLLNTLNQVMVAPVSAIQNGAPGSYVYIIAKDNTVSVRPVTTGQTSGEMVQILSGLEIGDKVVVDGADRLREGAEVTVTTQEARIAAAITAAAAAAAAKDKDGATGHGHRHRHDNADAATGTDKPAAGGATPSTTETPHAGAGPQQPDAGAPTAPGDVPHKWHHRTKPADGETDGVNVPGSPTEGKPKAPHANQQNSDGSSAQPAPPVKAP